MKAEDYELLLRRRFAKARMVCSPRLRGQMPSPGMQQVLREAMGVFQAQLLPTLRPGDVWFVQEVSLLELRQFLVPRADLLEFLHLPKILDLTQRTRNTLTQVTLGPGQIFWVCFSLGSDLAAAQIGSGRLNLLALPAAG